jgi:hypothetical protein
MASKIPFLPDTDDPFSYLGVADPEFTGAVVGADSAGAGVTIVFAGGATGDSFCFWLHPTNINKNKPTIKHSTDFFPFIYFASLFIK